MITANLIPSLLKLYPQIATTQGNIAYDANGNEVAYDLAAVTAQAEVDAQAVIDAQQSAIVAKESALAKLAALGLTQDEVKALVG
jgi:hypothetical protein